MIVQNYSSLVKEPDISTGLKIINEGLESALPKKELDTFFQSKIIKIGAKRINLSKYDSIFVVAFGKASNSMAKAVNSNLKIKKGIIVVPKGTRSIIKNKKFQIFKSGHPIPDNTSIRAAKSVLSFLKQRTKKEQKIYKKT